MSEHERRKPWDWASVRAAGATYARAWGRTLLTGNTGHKLGLAATAVALVAALALLVRRTKRGQGDGGANDVAPRGADVPAPVEPADRRVPTATSQGTTHTVEPGDTLGDIAQRYRATASALVEANSLTYPNFLQIGQQITVPSLYQDTRPSGDRHRWREAECIAEQESLHQLGTRIQIVWPHDGRGNPAPVGEARAVNIAVDIFLHGTRRSVPLEFARAASDAGQPVLYVAKGNDMMTWVRNDAPIATAGKTEYAIGGQRFPRWVFNNVPVSPGTQYHFLVVVRGDRVAYPTVWTHAESPQTQLPNPEPPPQTEDCR